METDVPPALLDHDQWVCWRVQSRGETPTKVPVNPTTGQYASTNIPETWVSFDEARKYARSNAGNGVGFVFTDDDPFVGVDLDDARDPATDEPTDWAATIIDRLESYTEISPSGTGYHVLVDGSLPPGRNRRGDIELYENGRFFTVTGEHVEGSPTTIQERTEELTTIYDAHVAVDDTSESDDSTTGEGEPTALNDDHESTAESVSSEPKLADGEVIKRARSAANGAKFERLWRGDTAGYDSHSEADMALCCLLAFWTGGETGQIDRLVRRSGLHREKWDAVHYADGSTYGETTIERATNVTSASYSSSDDADGIGTDTDGSDGGDHATTVESPQSVSIGDDGETPYHERERARIETITELERRLRELELETERLRDERDAERARRQELEDESSSDSIPHGFGRFTWIFGHDSG